MLTVLRPSLCSPVGLITLRTCKLLAICCTVVMLGTAGVGADIQYWLDDVPDYLWYYGCSPTAGGNLIGYWDNQPGYENLYAGTAPMTAPHSDPIYDIITSPEHITEPYTPNECAHTNAPNSLSCFMHTDPSNGGSYSWNIATGLRRFAAWDDPNTEVNESYDFTSFVYYAPQAHWADIFNEAAFTFNDLVREIDSGRPLLLNMSLVGGGHSVAAYGYWIDDDGDRWFATRDTWRDGDSTGYMGVDARLSSGQEWWRYTHQQVVGSAGDEYFVSSAVPFIPNDSGPIVEETDFGNDPASALTIYASAETIYASAETIYASLTEGDEDWYRIWLDTGDRAVFTTQSDRGFKEAIDTQIRLYDEGGTWLAVSNNTSSLHTNVSNLFWRAQDSGWHYARIMGGENFGMPQTGEYALTYYYVQYPEPGTILLVSVGLVGIVLRRRGRRRADDA
ncbi:MAG: PEP-CTERM sorting domain-containing protein [Armatimonadota bacterium]|jgi:hypothetical protein